MVAEILCSLFGLVTNRNNLDVLMLFLIIIFITGLYNVLWKIKVVSSKYLEMDNFSIVED